MGSKFFNLIIICGLLLISTTVTAQTESESRFLVGIDFITGFPQNEFKDNVKNTGFGLAGEFLYHIPNSPLFVGAGLNFLVYGTQSRREAISPNIPDLTVEVRNSNNIFLGDVILRAQPFSGNSIRGVNPYVEGLFGFNYLWTETTIDDEDWDDDDTDFSSTNYSDTALNYGVGAGIMFKIMDGKDDSDLQSLYLDINVRYMFGEKAKYLKKGGIILHENKVTYDPSESTTDLILPRIGVTMVF